MLKRLGLGLLKGVILGGAIGAALHFGLGWTFASGIGAYLVAMGAGASAGVLTGKPPWQQAAWVESLLKAAAGLGVGALFYWAASKWAGFALPFNIPDVMPGTSWTNLPLIFSPAVAGVFGALVEADNTGEDQGSTERGERKAPRARVEVIEEAEVVEEPAEKKSRRAER